MTVADAEQQARRVEAGPVDLRRLGPRRHREAGHGGDHGLDVLQRRAEQLPLARELCTLPRHRDSTDLLPRDVIAPELVA